MNRFNLFLLLEGYLKGLYYSLSNVFNFKYCDSINRIVNGNNVFWSSHKYKNSKHKSMPHYYVSFPRNKDEEHIISIRSWLCRVVSSQYYL